MKIQVKRLINPNTSLPYQTPLPLVATPGAAAADFYAAGRSFMRMVGDKLQEIPASNVRAGDLVKYNTGMAIEIESGYFGLACARSSICKMPLALANGIGVIDSDYRGELSYFYRILDPIDIENTSYKVGERCGQILIVKHSELQFEESADLSDTTRGTGGYGSTGK